MQGITALEHTLAQFDWLGDISAAVALAGVVLAAAMRLGDIWPFARRFPAWPRLVETFAVVLVIAGLAGQIFAARKTRDIAEKITASALTKTARTDEHIKELQKETAQLRLQLARFKWRVITPEQQTAVVDWLKKGPKGPVLVLYQPEDEPSSFATQIRDVLAAAGFEVKLQERPATLSVTGTFLLVQDLEHPPPQAVPIQNAFREIHIDLDGQQDAVHVPSGATVVILIGTRRV